MTGFAVRGWCPGALRPMMSGDGLVVRVKPRLARLKAVQLRGLCAAARMHGAGLIDLTGRANLQLRGVTEAALPALQDDLERLGLLDATPELEARRNILVAPLWREGDDTHRIAGELSARLAELPALPSKFGFAVDAGPAPVLTGDPADIRVERADDGGLMLRAEGRAMGIALAYGGEADAVIALAHWFATSGGLAAGRMARFEADLPRWAAGTAMSAPAAAPLRPGRHDAGAVVGLAFGQTGADELERLFAKSRAHALRVTPWRMAMLEGAMPVSAPGFVTDPASPLLRIDACVGAPHCPQASVATRDLAARLAGRVDGRLHLSGCAKGCARARSADVVLTGREGRYDLALQARAGDKPIRSGLNADDVLAHFGTA